MTLKLGQRVSVKGEPAHRGEVASITPTGLFRVRFDGKISVESFAQRQLSINQPVSPKASPGEDKKRRAASARRKQKRHDWAAMQLAATFREVNGREPTEEELAAYL